jgi:hypothetical protein
MFVVVGATGNTGSAVVETLLSKKQPVRIIVRSADKGAAWKAKGADVAVASLDDVPALTKAFEGAAGVYLMVPPNYGATAWLSDQEMRMDRAAEAVKKSGVSHVVFLSSIGGQLPNGTGPIRAVHYGEGKLTGAVKHITILRPSYFMENWAPVIGTGGLGKQIVEMAGPAEYSPDEVASALSQIVRKTITAQHAPLSAVVPTFKSFGFSDEAAKMFEEMYTSFSKGAITYEHPNKLMRGTVTLHEALRGMV